jgi:hypothetical protein
MIKKYFLIFFLKKQDESSTKYNLDSPIWMFAFTADLHETIQKGFFLSLFFPSQR